MGLLFIPNMVVRCYKFINCELLGVLPLNFMSYETFDCKNRLELILRIVRQTITVQVAKNPYICKVFAINECNIDY